MHFNYIGTFENELTELAEPMFSGDAPVIPNMEPPSVKERIRAARQAPDQPGKDTPQKHKSKGGPEL